MNPHVEKILKLPVYQRLLILLGILAVIVGLFIYLLYMPNQEELSRLQERNRSLDVTLRETKRIADDLPKFQAEYEKMQARLNEALSELPNEKEIPNLLKSIAALAKDQGLEVLLFQPGGEVPRGFYAEVPVSLKLQGSFHDLVLFFQEVGNLSRIVNIGNLKIGNSKMIDGRNVLSVECKATTFRFLQASEKSSKGKK